MRTNSRWHLLTSGNCAALPLRSRKQKGNYEKEKRDGLEIQVVGFSEIGLKGEDEKKNANQWEPDEHNMFRSNGLWNTLLEHGKPKSPESDTLIQQKLISQLCILDLIATSDQISVSFWRLNLQKPTWHPIVHWDQEVKSLWVSNVNVQSSPS